MTEAGKNEKREFELRDVLAVLIDQSISGTERFYQVLSHMFRQPIGDKELSDFFGEALDDDFAEVCRDGLVSQYPALERINLLELDSRVRAYGKNVTRVVIDEEVDAWVGEQKAILKESGIENALMLSPLSEEVCRYWRGALDFIRNRPENRVTGLGHAAGFAGNQNSLI